MAVTYIDTFITVSDDCELRTGVIPPERGGKKTAAGIQYDLLADHPYVYTMEDVLFRTHVELNQLHDEEEESLRDVFFSTPKACLRTSTLVKRYGWGLHFDHEGKVALYGAESEEYRTLRESPHLHVVKGMRSKRLGGGVDGKQP
ncbi:DUF6157 family protein [Gorillibacterium sp. CAU 1737]|uniref:DUF6157 family protein n=1 Tax=Gorillibacterium sp. CAU 1737 TaxID=3140362 RepID=UPI0032610957